MTEEICWALFWVTGAPEYYALYREFMEALASA
jgi:hypothetical protein